MKTMDNNTRFSRKLENFLWWLIKLLPLILFLIVNIGFFTAKPIWQFFANDTDFSDFFNPGLSFEVCLGHLGFHFENYISVMLEDIFYNVLHLPVGRPILAYFSYLVFIEIIHFFYHFMVFIIRWANSLFERLFKY